MRTARVLVGLVLLALCVVSMVDLIDAGATQVLVP